jgi:hypothetical protein
MQILQVRSELWKRSQCLSTKEHAGVLIVIVGVLVVVLFSCGGRRKHFVAVEAGIVLSLKT